MDWREGQTPDNKRSVLMETFSKNPNPVLRAGKDGTIIRANSVASSLIEMWKVNEGEKLP